MKEVEAEKGIQIPDRGKLHDMGRSVTHKKEIHGSSVKEFKLHNIAIFHTNYASSRFDPISRLTCCSLFDQANLTVLATEIAASLRFFS